MTVRGVGLLGDLALGETRIHRLVRALGGRGFRVMSWRFGVLYEYSESTLLFY